MHADIPTGWPAIRHKALKYTAAAVLKVLGYKLFIDPYFHPAKILNVFLFWIFFIIPSAYLLTRIQNAIFVIFTFSKTINETEHATRKNTIASFVLEGLLYPALVVVAFYNYMLFMEGGAIPIVSPFNVVNLMDLFKARCAILFIGVILDLIPNLLKKHTAKLPPTPFGLQLVMETVWYVYVMKRLYFPLPVN